MPYIDCSRDLMRLSCAACDETVSHHDGAWGADGDEEVFICNDCIGVNQVSRALPSSVRIEATEEGITRVFYRGEWIAEVALYSNSDSYSYMLRGSDEVRRGFAFKMAAIRAAVLKVLEADLVELKELS